MNISELKAAGYEWIMHEMIRLKKIPQTYISRIAELEGDNLELQKELKAANAKLDEVDL